jgi:hypothetical protein
MVALALAPSALAQPTGEYAPFDHCPYGLPAVDGCLLMEFTSGSLVLGSRTVPVVNPITFQGGVSGFGPGTQFYDAVSADTLSNTPQPVPGGLNSVTAPTSWPALVQSWWNEQISNGLTGVNLTIEQAAPASSIALDLEAFLFESGTALGLPVVIKLSNAILGSNCYVGSTLSPLQLELTTGISGARTGTTGTITFNGPATIVTITGLKLVDGTFAAPSASGCGGGYSPYVDPLIDSLFGLPAGSGSNALQLEGDLEFAEAAAAAASDP